VRVGFLSLMLVFAGAFVPVAAQALAQTYQLDIPRQQLDAALKDLAQQTGLQIARFSDTPGGSAFVGPVSGNMPVADALNTLLAPSKLTYKVVNDHTIAVMTLSAAAVALTARDAVTADQSISSTDGGAKPQEGKKSSSGDFRVAQVDQTNAGPQTIGDDQNSDKKKKEGALAEIIVTGTHIRGAAAAGSALTVYSREDIEQSGVATVDQFARKMTENFSNIDVVADTNSNLQFAQVTGSNVNNAFFGAGFNLHGVGSTATLTLVNGHRLAPSGSDGSLADVSQIPLSAIDHIDVLTGGASAIYGADAIAGVVNIVTRKDYEGAETTVRYGTATEGGATEVTASQLLGKSWSGGNVMLNYEYDKQNGLDASQRDYIGPQGGPVNLIPPAHRNSVFVEGRQDINEGTSISGNASYSDRSFFAAGTQFVPGSFLGSNSIDGQAKQSNVALTLDRAIVGDWTAQIMGDYSKVQQRSNLTSGFTLFDPAFSSVGIQITTADSSVAEVNALLSGTVVSLPGGNLKTALGASFRREAFAENQAVLPAPGIGVTATRHVTSVYGELSIPVVGPANALSGLRRLELSAAARYDDYSDLGATTNPKVGMLWEPIAGLNIRGTYGKSFRAPLLSQLKTPVAYYTYPLADSGSPSGFTDTLIDYGGNTNLRPERSKSFTTGLDFVPMQSRLRQPDLRAASVNPGQPLA